MNAHTLTRLFRVVAILVMIALTAQLVFLAATLLSIAGIETPLVSVSREDNTITFRGNPYAVIPLSAAIVLLASYLIERKKPPEDSGKIKSYLYGAVIVVVILLLVFLLVYLASCGLACAMLACGIGNVRECSFIIGWLYVVIRCICR